jgi:class 3 adenylate cyclase
MRAATVKQKPPTAEGAVVFTDLTGFSEFTAIRGDEAALEMLALQEDLLQKAMRSRGRIVKNLGDGFLLWFPTVADAVDSALALQSLIDDLPGDDDMALWVRIGINYGRPILRGDDLIGHDVNVAARIVDLAQSGEVLVSEVCRQYLDHELPGVYFDEIGPVVMKGIPDAVTLYRAVRL